MSRLLAIVIMHFVFSSVADAADIWVDAVSGDNGNNGSTLLLAKKTISGPTGAMAAANANDTIKVVQGAYDVASNGETFPITIKEGVDILGQETAEGNYPRIGGDLLAGSAPADALFVIDATTANQGGIEIKKLRFLGEDVASADSAVALIVTIADGHSVSLAFEHNICERPYLNSSGSAGYATVDISCMEAGEIEGTIKYCDIEVSDRGGLAFTVMAAAESVVSANAMTINSNLITNPDTVAALFGIRWHALESDPDFTNIYGPNTITGNTILGQGGRLVAGVELICEEYTNYGQANFSDNTIGGCSGNGLKLVADGWDDPGVPEISLISFNRNRITQNDGSGILLSWDPTAGSGDQGMGYLHFTSGEGNLIADNGSYGVEFLRLGEFSKGSIDFINTTIVYNDDGAEGFVNTQFSGSPAEDLGAGSLPKHKNCIVWENNDGGDQAVGLPEVLETLLFANVVYTDWQGISSGTGNISSDPKFVSAASKNYHLDPTASPASPCLDAGSNEYVLIALDIDRELRKQDGDCDESDDVDMGYDEVPEDCE
jgi:hypothetical protein